MDWPYAKTAVITGSASGIGKAIAEEAIRQGFKVGMVDFDEESAGQTRESLERAGGACESFQCDVRNLEEVQAAADYFFDAWGEVGLLVNNAGVGTAGYVGDIPMEEWERVIDTNLWGVIYGCHAFIPRMKEQGGGHIVNTASMAGIVPPAQESPYNVAKAGVVSLSETLKVELAPFNIGVTVLCPMSVNTNILENVSDTGDYLTEMFTISFSKAKITPEQIARMVMKAVEKNQLYLLPHLSGKMFWLNKRMMPSSFYNTMAYLNKKGMAVPFLMFLAKRGWL